MKAVLFTLLIAAVLLAMTFVTIWFVDHYKHVQYQQRMEVLGL